MKKLVSKDFTVDPARLFLPIAQTMEHLQEAYSEAIDAIMTSCVGGSPAGGYILSGCVDTVGGGNHSLSAGAIYFFLNASAWSGVTTYAQYDLVSIAGNEYVSLSAGNLNHDPTTSPTFWVRVGGHQTGQIFSVDAIVLNALANVVVAKIVPTFASSDPTAYTDGSTANVHVIFKIKFFDAVTGTGIADFLNLVSFNFWHAIGTTGEPAFQNAWGNVGGGNGVKFKLDYNNHAEIKGSIFGGASGTVAFTLPVKFRPIHAGSYAINADAENGKVARAVIATNGDVSIYFSAGAATIDLNGLRLPLD